MKITIWLTLAAIMILGVTLLVQKDKNGKAGSVTTVTTTETPSQPRVDSPVGTEESTVVTFTLQTVAEDGKLLFQGVGGEIDGMINPDLHVPVRANVEITRVNADGMPHNISLPDFMAQSSYVAKIGVPAIPILPIRRLMPSRISVCCCRVMGCCVKKPMAASPLVLWILPPY